MNNEIEERLKLTCSWCFHAHLFLKLHEKEANNCPTNCLRVWQQILHEHYQEEAQKEEENHD
ncbi:MAG: hypothetical protein MRECE_42c010 [Mycoplasmataceae bacterium CE_OT135]|nr:MAG: hypothetical protein MRECE_42c010 [Mycoplasmataceae bacterium CE_OT135]